MFCKWSSVVCVWLVTASLLTAAEPAAPGVSPQFVVVTKLDAKSGEVEVQLVVQKPVTETFEQAITNPATGNVEIETLRRIKNVAETRARRIKLADTQVMTAKQKVIDPIDVIERLKPDTAVLLQDSDRKLDARYLATLKDETLILIVTPPPPKVAPLLPGPSEVIVPRQP